MLNKCSPITSLHCILQPHLSLHAFTYDLVVNCSLGWPGHPYIPPTNLGVCTPAFRTFSSTVISLLTGFPLPLCLFESDHSLAKAFPCSEVTSQLGIPNEPPRTAHRAGPLPRAIGGDLYRANMGRTGSLAKGKESLPYLHPLPTSHHSPIP